MTQNLDFFQSHLLVLALGFLFIKLIIFVIFFINSKSDDKFIANNIARIEKENQLQAQIQFNQQPIYSSANDIVTNWKTEDPRLSHDMRQQFLSKTKTRRTPTIDSGSYRASPRSEKVLLATVDNEVSWIKNYDHVVKKILTNIQSLRIPTITRF